MEVLMIKVNRRAKSRKIGSGINAEAYMDSSIDDTT